MSSAYSQERKRIRGQKRHAKKVVAEMRTLGAAGKYEAAWDLVARSIDGNPFFALWVKERMAKAPRRDRKAWKAGIEAARLRREGE